MVNTKTALRPSSVWFAGGGRGIGHDLVDQPTLERADQPLVPVVDHKQGVAIGVCLPDHHKLLRLLDREGVVGSSGITTPPATIVAVPSASAVPRGR